MKRIYQIIRKEFIQIRRDSGLMRMVILTPLIQLLIYGYVVATDIRALPVVVYDQSESEESRRMVDRFISSGYFALEEHVASLTAVTDHLNSGRSIMAIVIPVDYTKNIRRGTRATIQLLLDGTNSNTATIALGYANGIVAVENDDRMRDNFDRKGLRIVQAGIREEPRVWFNPSLRAINYMVPGIICVLLMELMMPLTAFSLVRERERGTIEQLTVTPIRATEMLIGKCIPYVLIGLGDSLVILAAGVFWFKVPMAGSLLTLLAASS